MRAAVARTIAAERMAVRLRLRWGAEDPETTMDARGAIDVAAGTGRLAFHTVGPDAEVVRETALEGGTMLDRLPGTAVWRTVGAGVAGAFTDDLLGFAALVPRVLRWAPDGSRALDDGAVASAYRGLLPRRLGILYPADVISLLTTQRLPRALGHRRVLHARVDADGRLRRLAITTTRDGLRHPAKWLVLDLSELGAAEVPPRAAERTLTGSPLRQLKQQFDAVRAPDGAP